MKKALLLSLAITGIMLTTTQLGWGNSSVEAATDKQRIVMLTKQLAETTQQLEKAEELLEKAKQHKQDSRRFIKTITKQLHQKVESLKLEIDLIVDGIDAFDKNVPEESPTADSDENEIAGLSSVAPVTAPSSTKPAVSTPAPESKEDKVSEELTIKTTTVKDGSQPASPPPLSPAAKKQTVPTAPKGIASVAPAEPTDADEEAALDSTPPAPPPPHSSTTSSVASKVVLTTPQAIELQVNKENNVKISTTKPGISATVVPSVVPAEEEPTIGAPTSILASQG